MGSRTALRFAKIDFVIQIFMIGLNTLLMVGSLLGGLMFVSFLLIQLILGLYQLFVSGIYNYFTTEHDHRFKKIRGIYIVSALAYVISFIFIGKGFNLFGKPAEIIILAVIPQLFAYAYFILSYFDLRARHIHTHKILW